jgi:very-short-patch-repair endonuclease
VNILRDQMLAEPVGQAAVFIEADLAKSFTYASFQNAVPVLRSISIANFTGEDLGNCSLELTASPSFVRPKRWQIDRLPDSSSTPLVDRSIELDPGYLAGLNEAEHGRITLRFSSSGTVLAEETIPVRLLARDEWGGVEDMAALLAAFVMPNDAGATKILKEAADILAAHNLPSGMDGYQSSDTKRTHMLIQAVYAAVCRRGLHYAEPPASFERQGQKVRRPQILLGQGLATCLDSALLFASALEAAGLNTTLVLFERHAVVGVWRVRKTLPRMVEPDVIELRKAIAANELVVFETTGVTHRPALPFKDACRVGRDLLSEQQERAFVLAIDVARARAGGIRPLASHDGITEKTPENESHESTIVLPPDEEIPPPPHEEVDEKPTTPDGRIDRWQRKLLDLSLRNRLLNFSDSRRTIPFLCRDIASLEDRLSEGSRVRIISLPDQNPISGRDADTYRQIQEEFSQHALARNNELGSPLEKRELDARLIALHRQSRSDLAEGGTNTLFLAVGFLRWKKNPEDERAFRAPLLLIPVKLERRSATSRFDLVYHEDEDRFNATLAQFLERDFGLSLPGLAGELPRDENGVDVPRVMELMRRAVRDASGFEVVDETALSTFSFAKYLMWKDLVDRTDALRKNRVVAHLIDNPDQAFPTGGSVFPREQDIDRNYAPSDIITPLPADSSQLSASIAAAAGNDFVLVGPPGTGKSQTIANMIANCLARGKSVLFVAEKTAALDVVYRRLREHGLGNRCLELHSNRADRRQFLSQLKTAWETGGAAARQGEWNALTSRLESRRDELNAYVEALHRLAPCGLTPFSAIARLASQSDVHAPRLTWSTKDAHDRDSYNALAELADQIGRLFPGTDATPALALVNQVDWSFAWQEGLLRLTRDVRVAGESLASALMQLRAAIGLSDDNDSSLDGLQRFADFASHAQAMDGKDCSLFFEPGFDELRDALDPLAAAIADFDRQYEPLSAIYERSELLRVPTGEIDRAWREAGASIWPKAWMAKRRVTRLLQSYAQLGPADPDRDLLPIRALQEQAAAVLDNIWAANAKHFAGLDTNTTALSLQMDQAFSFRVCFARLLQLTGEAKTVVPAVSQAVRRREHQGLIEASQRYSQAHERFHKTLRNFEMTSCSRANELLGDRALAELDQLMRDLEESRDRLRDWSSWCAAREKGHALGLGPLTDDLRNGAIRPGDTKNAFQVAYARWWLPLAIDTEPHLRKFHRVEHEHAADDFRRMDDLVREQAALQVNLAITHGLPTPAEVPKQSELGLLRHQMQLQRPSKSIRDMVTAMPQSFTKLAPCILMSPLSIAQYLPANQALFDVVIFDEASQITTWDAVGAIARGRQTVIVGDPMQLPPTNFFGRSEGDQEDVEYFEKDLESILDEAKASGLPVHGLRWHYRSRHESLIAFSNWHYYGNRLVTFPSPRVDDRAVTLRKVPDGVYDRGKSRTNKEEARAIVAAVTERLKDELKKPENQRLSLGIITFNIQQQSLIQDYLDEMRRADAAMEWFFSEDRIEPLIVKNLENVQGDERDIILFSLTFTKDHDGRLSMAFGALNRDGGERRLNVAVTRARQELLVFSGMSADEIDLSRTKAKGVEHLKAFLGYADRGVAALPQQDRGSVGPAESPFEEAVAEELRRRGWHVVTQVGVSEFRIDLGIKHPDRAGAYLAAVECDGRTYHSSATARDRDKVREQVLRNLGWEIFRVWSPDWWFDRKNAADRLHHALNAHLAADRGRAED